MGLMGLVRGDLGLNAAPVMGGLPFCNFFLGVVCHIFGVLRLKHNLDMGHLLDNNLELKLNLVCDSLPVVGPRFENPSLKLNLSVVESGGNHAGRDVFMLPEQNLVDIVDVVVLSVPGNVLGPVVVLFPSGDLFGGVAVDILLVFMHVENLDVVELFQNVLEVQLDGDDNLVAGVVLVGVGDPVADLDLALMEPVLDIPRFDVRFLPGDNISFVVVCRPVVVVPVRTSGDNHGRKRGGVSAGLISDVLSASLVGGSSGSSLGLALGFSGLATGTSGSFSVLGRER